MTKQGLAKQIQPIAPVAEQRKEFLERMERKLTNKLAARHIRRQLLRTRLQFMRKW